MPILYLISYHPYTLASPRDGPQQTHLLRPQPTPLAATHYPRPNIYMYGSQDLQGCTLTAPIVEHNLIFYQPIHKSHMLRFPIFSHSSSQPYTLTVFCLTTHLLSLPYHPQHLAVSVLDFDLLTIVVNSKPTQRGPTPLTSDHPYQTSSWPTAPKILTKPPLTI
jgi:hypothetical protein